MLVWNKRDDGWWEAPVPPIRVAKKIARMRCPPGTEPTDADYWVEIGGTYFIGKSEMTYDELQEWQRYRERRDRFRRQHHPAYRADDEDERHCFRVGCQPKGGGCLSSIKNTYTLGGARVEAETHYSNWCKAALVAITGSNPPSEKVPHSPPRPVVWEIVHPKGSDPGKAFVTCEFVDERDPDFERLGEFATREEAEAFLAADVRELASSVDHPRHYSAQERRRGAHDLSELFVGQSEGLHGRASNVAALPSEA